MAPSTLSSSFMDTTQEGDAKTDFSDDAMNEGEPVNILRMADHPPPARSDVCVVGAGPTGTMLA
jgi:NADPH-dependent 2,4-dienoyl-CoA reductase/sulfur reductase-like enzyme